MRILQAAHEWEGLHPGGAQRAARSLAIALRKSGYHVEHVASIEAQSHPSTVGKVSWDSATQTTLVPSATLSPIPYWKNVTDSSRLWTEVLECARPDVVHLHHMINLGLELPNLIRRIVPNATLVLTLHEYFAICAQDGQMIKSNGQLCHESSLPLCAACRQTSLAEVALRRRIMIRYLDAFDHLISPSSFLKRRYLNWGIDADRIQVIPNVVLGEPIPERTKPKSEHPKFGYLGQFTPYKGLEVLVAAVREANARLGSERFSVDVYGVQAEDLRRADKDLATPENVHFHGKYGLEEIGSILAHLNCIIVPSTWWENAPYVIEEAKLHGTPVLASDIGGMAEKVTIGVDGWHFRARDAHALASEIIRLVRNPDELRLTPSRPPSEDLVVDAHLDLYRSRATHAVSVSLTPKGEIS